MSKNDWIVAFGAFCSGAVIGWVTTDPTTLGKKRESASVQNLDREQIKPAQETDWHITCDADTFERCRKDVKFAYIVTLARGLKSLDSFFGFSDKNPGPTILDITTDTGRRFAKRQLDEGFSTATINRSLACLRRMLRIAHEDGKVQTVPIIRLQKEPPARKGFLTPEKFEELLGVLPTHLRPLILFLYWCGVRLGEAQAIEWSQVDLQGRLVRLEQDQTKNAVARIVPLPAVLVEALTKAHPKTGRVFDDANLRLEWARACSAVGLGRMEDRESEEGNAWKKYSGLIVHDLRRSAVRNLVNAGIPERVAMGISGHKTRSVFDRYHIVSTEDVSNAMQRLETASLNGQKKPTISVKLVTKPGRKARKLLRARSSNG